MDYSYTLGSRNNRYQLITGRMDSGLRISYNRISGVPEREGKYSFQIRETDPRGNIIDTWYSLKIIKARLTVQTTPDKVTMDRNRSGSFDLTYIISSSEQLDDTITSARGVFLAGNRTLGTVTVPLKVEMVRGKAQVREKVTVPLDVIKKAQRSGIDRIVYQRTFTARYMDEATTGSLAVTVGTGFTFTRIRITFLDHTSKKFVKRNETIDGARVELDYEGAGLLKGYWQVDDRILARVTRSLPFANSRTIVLTLPKVPPLPTSSTGSHRLRFVITDPAMNISFPQIIYIVTGDDVSKTSPIHLLAPRDGATINTSGLTFSWKPRHGVSAYRFEIFTQDKEGKNIVFSAFARKTTYVVPARIAEKKFAERGTWKWQVTGLNQKNKPVAASAVRSFSVQVDALESKMVPGRILMLFAAGDKNRNSRLISTMTQKYDLRMESRTVLPRLDRELVVFSTSGDASVLIRRLRREQTDAVVQGDYLYSTLGRPEETRNRKMVMTYLGLDSMGTGKGMRVAVIDTGVDLDQEDLAGVILAHANFIPGSSYRAELHGTAVASVIHARLNHDGTAGIAPESRLIALRACEQRNDGEPMGRCYSSSILRALDRAMGEDADIVNMSLGTQVSDDMVARALDRALESGMILVAPAGNDPHQTSLVFPASHEGVVSVAGMSDNNKPMPNRRVAAMADLVLPARYVLVDLPGNRTTFMHGTSMASAEAAGLFAGLHPDADCMADCRNQDQLIACLVNARQ
jgi:hypothetical protein